MGYLCVPELTRTQTCIVDLSPVPRIALPRVFSLHVPPFLISGKIEVFERIPAAYRSIFWKTESKADVPRTRQNRVFLLRAAALLERLSITDLLADVTDSILLFNNSSKNSFYDTRAHGTVFIRFTKAYDEFHLIEEFVHQASHAIFSVLMARPNRYSQMSERAPIYSLNEGKRNSRPFGVALHGLVTEALIAETLFEMHSNLSLRNADQNQTLGRLAFATRKMVADLHLLAGFADQLTREGLILLRAIGFTCSKILDQLGASMEQINLANQRYVFSLNRFLSTNQFGSVNF